MELPDILTILTGQALGSGLIIVIVLFLLFKVWPWFVTDYIPNRRNTNLEIARALEAQAVALETFASEMANLVRELRA